MRILALMTDAYGGYGGIAQYNRDLLRALSASDLVHDVLVLPRLGQAAEGECPSKIRQLRPITSKLFYVFDTMLRTARNRRFDILFCGHIHLAPLAMLVGRIFRIPVWLQTHGIDAWDCPSALVRASSERATLITSVSRYTRSRILDWMNIDPFRVRVLSNTVRPVFTPGPPRADVLRRFGLSGRKVVLTVARISKSDEYKGHARVIEAMSAVRAAQPDALYVIVGDGDGRSDLEDLVAQGNLGPAVRFLGRLDDDDVLALYRSSDVFVMPSTKEGFGIVFVEAAASGLSVIGGNTDGSADALADGKIGQMIDPHSQNELISAILAALGDGARLSPDAVKRYSFPNFAGHVDALLQDFLRGGQGCLRS
ncbi:MAG: putative Phosphatidylinositol alpha-mannosyltransferase [Hyphomicrobiales bacterium]|nr:putative Phosphatidylinositol alpha-mannosyltransferase [Hyphomicrobiales bacterium]